MGTSWRHQLVHMILLSNSGVSQVLQSHFSSSRADYIISSWCLIFLLSLALFPIILQQVWVWSKLLILSTLNRLWDTSRTAKTASLRCALRRMDAAWMSRWPWVLRDENLQYGDWFRKSRTLCTIARATSWTDWRTSHTTLTALTSKSSRSARRTALVWSLSLSRQPLHSATWGKWRKPNGALLNIPDEQHHPHWAAPPVSYLGDGGAPILGDHQVWDRCQCCSAELDPATNPRSAAQLHPGPVQAPVPDSDPGQPPRGVPGSDSARSDPQRVHHLCSPTVSWINGSESTTFRSLPERRKNVQLTSNVTIKGGRAPGTTRQSFVLGSWFPSCVVFLFSIEIIFCRPPAYSYFQTGNGTLPWLLRCLDATTTVLPIPEPSLSKILSVFSYSSNPWLTNPFGLGFLRTLYTLYTVPKLPVIPGFL